MSSFYMHSSTSGSLYTCLSWSNTHPYEHTVIYTSQSNISTNVYDLLKIRSITKQHVTEQRKDDAEGPSAAHWGADETHIPDSNLLLETKGLWGEGSVPSPRAAIFTSITILRLNKQPKYLPVKHGFNRTVINGNWQGFKIKTAKPCRHTVRLSVLKELN